MKWKGNKYCRQVRTEEGYLLRAEFLSDSKFWWIVYKNNEIIQVARQDGDYKTTLNGAQKTAQQRMIKHLKQASS